MIMRVLAPSPATASDATTTSGLGSGLGSSSKKIVVVISNSFYVVFCLIVVRILSFIQIGQKIYKLKIIALGRLWLVSPVGQKMAVFISNSLLNKKNILYEDDTYIY